MVQINKKWNGNENEYTKKQSKLVQKKKIKNMFPTFSINTLDF